MLDPDIPVPSSGRVFRSRRRIRLADVDPRGRVRLDAIARLLQDVAIDDVQETGWGMPEHLWFVRRIRVDVQEPFREDREIEPRRSGPYPVAIARVSPITASGRIFRSTTAS